MGMFPSRVVSKRDNFDFADFEYLLSEAMADFNSSLERDSYRNGLDADFMYKEIADFERTMESRINREDVEGMADSLWSFISTMDNDLGEMSDMARGLPRDDFSNSIRSLSNIEELYDDYLADY